MHGQARTGKRYGWVAIILAALFVIILGMALLLGRTVIDNLESQRSASSDNVQWTLTQVEVEYLAYLNALSELTYSRPEALAAKREDLRTQFDVFYSRVDTLEASPLFADLRITDAYAEPLAAVRAYLNAAVPYIDAERPLDTQRAQILMDQAEDLQGSVRALSLSGLAHFASQSDARRVDTAETLYKLALASLALLFMLAALSGYLLWINRKMRQRGRALAQANQRIQTVLATSLDAVIVVDAHGTVLEFNPAAETIFGHSRSEVLGQTIGDLIVPEHQRGAHKAGMERMRSGGPRKVVGKGRVQLDAMRANGEIFPVELALESAFDGMEEIIIGYMRDISARIAARTELITARDEALAGEKAKANFLTVMSHEIRTPLNGLLGNLSLLSNTKLTADQAQYVRNMDISGRVLMTHVDSVLNIARFEADKLILARDAFSISALMQEIVDGQSGNAASRDNVIEWQWVGDAHPWVLSDEQRLRQILLNLVGNAIKFTEKGRISLEVECMPRSSGQAGSCAYEFRVIDSGIGISAADQDRIFEDFETSDPSLGRAADGTGLGLGIARRFAQALGGELGVESEPGAGSVFWLRLTLEETLPSQGNTDAHHEPLAKQPLDVLVVEDNEINSEVIRRMLELDNHNVTLAENGKAGVDAACAKRFDVILMDISMPVMDGATATRRIREGDGLSRHAPIIAVSANVLPGAVESFREAGMDAFVGKPLSVDALRHAISTIVDGRATSGEAATPAAAPAPSGLSDLFDQLGAQTAQKLLGGFLGEADALMARLETVDFAGPQAKEAADDVHKLLGSAGVLGLTDLHSALRSCETALLTGDASQAGAAAEQSRALWSDLRPGIQAVLARP